MLHQTNISGLGFTARAKIQEIGQLIEAAMSQAKIIKDSKKNLELASKLSFYKIPTQTILTNSSAQTLTVYDHPHFGKRFIQTDDSDVVFSPNKLNESTTFTLPSLNTIVDFINSFN